MKRSTGSRGWSLAGSPLTFYLLLLLPVLFLLVFYVYPLIEIFRTSFGGGSGTMRDTIGSSEASLLTEALSRLLSASTLRLIGFTLGQALLSTALTLLLGLPGAYILAHYEFPGKALFNALTTVPFVLPTVVVSAAFTAVIGPRSPLNTLLMTWFDFDQPPLDLRYTFGAILAAHVFYNYTLVTRMVGSFWANLDPRLVQAARTLGASRWRAFREITLPLLAPALSASALLVFIFCFTSFGVVLILGGPRFATLEVAIYRQTVNFANLPLAAALSLVQIIFTLGFASVYARLQSKLARPLNLRPRWSTQRHPTRPYEVILIGVNSLMALLCLGLPLLTLVIRSFGAGLRYYTALGENPRRSIFYVPPLEAVFNSLKLASGATVLALLLGTLAALALHRRRQDLKATGESDARAVARAAVAWIWDALFMLPLGTSSVTLGLGYLLAMDKPPLDLRGSAALIVFGHTLAALPFVVRSVLPALQSIRPALREAAAVLGASPLEVFIKVDLPIIWRALAVGAVFAFTVSMGEFGATAMIARPDLPTIPIAIYRFLSRPGALNYGQALAMATILMGVCVVGFVVMEYIRPPGERLF